MKQTQRSLTSKKAFDKKKLGKYFKSEKVLHIIIMYDEKYTYYVITLLNKIADTYANLEAV